MGHRAIFSCGVDGIHLYAMNDAAVAAKVYDGKTEVTSGTLSTGMTAVVGNKSYTLVVTGDVNGDGKITLTDVVALQSHVLDKKTLEGAYREAADLNSDGYVTLTDVVKAARVIIGKDTIG